MNNEQQKPLNFIEQIIKEDLENGLHDGRVHTRFPPEPNGYLHIGHAKAITLNFEIAQKFGGKTNLRFDDTNPTTEETEYVESIKRDIRWLGFEWENDALFTSDYFEKLYEFALKLIDKGLAYVDDSSPEEIAEMKGDIGVPGKESPYRNRSVAENRELFEQMRAGAFPDGAKVLRAKIDMAHGNLLMRDPLLYRIKRDYHHRTGDKWCIYPMYDFAHGQSDSIEHITHSLCSLEFQHHRELYNWLIEKLEIFPSRQIEFARMNVAYLITSKRKLRRLVEEGHVKGWDDPRMPTLAAMRRRGYPPMAIRTFCNKAGVTQRDNLIDMSLLDFCVRDELNKTAPRVMAVLDPLKVVITNYPEDKVEQMEVINNPEDDTMGTRLMPFSREVYIERKDFMEDPPKKFFRMGPGRNVRLKGAYILHCEDYVKDETTGEIKEVHCTYYPDSRSGEDTSGIRSKGTLHWVSIPHARPCEVRLYDRLFSDPTPDQHEGKDYMDFLNPNSLEILEKAYIEPNVGEQVKPGQQLQFLRMGYFCVDPDSSDEHWVFNRTVMLRDTWKKIKNKQK